MVTFFLIAQNGDGLLLCNFVDFKRGYSALEVPQTDGFDGILTNNYALCWINSKHKLTQFQKVVYIMAHIVRASHRKTNTMVCGESDAIDY
jgi:hypothetical protein